MLNFREFQAGPDPFGRKFQVFFKWLQTAISIRHADTVDVKFILRRDGGSREDHRAAARRPDGRQPRNRAEMDDPWCARIAESHLVYLVEPARTWKRIWSR